MQNDSGKGGRMLRTIYHTEDVTGNEDGYPDRFFSESDDLIYVAEQRKEVEAFLSIEVYREDGHVYPDDFSVTAECRNKGTGTKLISLAEDYARSAGISGMFYMWIRQMREPISCTENWDI